jgi:DNA-binding transcriptional ArsR family regulator
MIEPYHPATLYLSSILYALADPSRLSLVQELVQETEIASPCFTSVQAARGTIAFHLKILRLAGITWTRLDGRRRMISLRRNHVDVRFPGLLDAVLAGAPPANLGGRA